MEQIKPTQFKRVNAGEMPNAEQLLCGKALDCVIALGVFESDYFNDVDLLPTNHLLSWCVEALTANEFEFFKKTDNVYHNYLVDSVILYFKEQYLYTMTRPYSVVFDLKTKTDTFFHKMLDEFSFDEAMGVLLGENNNIFTKMDAFRES